MGLTDPCTEYYFYLCAMYIKISAQRLTNVFAHPFFFDNRILSLAMWITNSCVSNFVVFLGRDNSLGKTKFPGRNSFSLQLELLLGIANFLGRGKVIYMFQSAICKVERSPTYVVIFFKFCFLINRLLSFKTSKFLSLPPIIHYWLWGVGTRTFEFWCSGAGILRRKDLTL